jgi:uncharacterized protein
MVGTSSPVTPTETAPIRSPRAFGARARPGGTSLGVVGFLVAAGVLALHVVDDSFLQPEPGTSAGDHLPGGLVPLAALGVAAAVYPRLRAGARAALALFVGILAIVVGATSAGYYVLTVGPSGDDYTGVLAILAGLFLVGLGIATLWTSRRLDDRLWWRYLRRALITAGGVVVAFELLFPIGLGYMATHVMRPSVPEQRLGTAYEDVAFTTGDGLRLEGWYIPSRNGAAVIAFPGRSGPQKHARMLARHGYGVLLFDRRGEGASEGDPNLFGWGGERDIDAAVAFLDRRPDVEAGRIGGIGFSVGGELMLQAAAESDGLAAVVSEGAGTRWLAEEIDEFDTISGSSKWLGLPLLAVKTGAVAVFSSTAPPPELTDLVRRIEQPLFLIWAPNGGNAETMNPVYYRLAAGPKTIWEMPDARHVQGITARPREYERRVVAFFDDALLDPAPG